MIPSAYNTGGGGVSCPHTRGDDPELFKGDENYHDLSPYAWG